MRIGIAAAGSGGHVYPALAVADALVANGIDAADITFFGGSRMEKTKVPDAGYSFVELDIHGLSRSMSTRNAMLPLKIRRAAASISAHISDRGIQAMIVFGGYVSGPAALAASRQGIPLVAHEANAVPGLAIRIVVRYADLVLVAMESAAARLKGSFVVGNPLRPAFDTFDREALRSSARMRYGIASDVDVLAVIGGSLGASALNEIAQTIATESDRTFSILHLTGEAHVAEVSAWAGEYPDWIVQAFEDEMEYVYAAADLVVSRSGAMTVAELEATGTPAIVVPLPAGRAYQGLNAAELAEAGGAVIVDQDEPERVVDLARELMADAVRRKQMATRADAAAHRGAADAVASMTMELIDA